MRTNSDYKALPSPIAPKYSLTKIDFLKTNSNLQSKHTIKWVNYQAFLCVITVKEK